MSKAVRAPRQFNRKTYVCLSSGRFGDDGEGTVDWTVASSSWWTAMEKRFQKAGSRTTDMVKVVVK